MAVFRVQKESKIFEEAVIIIPWSIITYCNIPYFVIFKFYGRTLLSGNKDKSGGFISYEKEGSGSLFFRLETGRVPTYAS